MIFNYKKIRNSFRKWAHSLKRETKMEKDVFENMKNWACKSDNLLLKDVAEKLFKLNVKINNEDLVERKVSTIQDFVFMFKRFKENDVSLNILKKKILNIELLVDRYEYKCSRNNTKNQRDYDVKLFRLKKEKEDLKLKYYQLYNENENVKMVLFKDKLLKLNREMIQRNRCEAAFLKASNELVESLPDKQIDFYLDDICSSDNNDIYKNAMIDLHNILLYKKEPSAPSMD